MWRGNDPIKSEWISIVEWSIRFEFPTHPVVGDDRVELSLLALHQLAALPQLLLVGAHLLKVGVDGLELGEWSA